MIMKISKRTQLCQRGRGSSGTISASKPSTTSSSSAARGCRKGSSAFEQPPGRSNPRAALPTLSNDLSSLSPAFALPPFRLPTFTWPELFQGALVLALPQVALTFGNAVMATAEENNRLFPDRPITVRQLAFDHGFMNLVAAGVGGVPMCRGGGGMAGHIRFGARTGGSVIVLGLVLLVVALAFAGSLDTLFRLFPMPILGVILFFGGIELAGGVVTEGFSAGERMILAVTAGIALWNMGVAYVVGLVLYHAWRRGLVRF